MAGGFLRFMPIDAAQVNFRDLARALRNYFIFEINKFNPTFALRRSNWIHISKAFETEPDALKKPDCAQSLVPIEVMTSDLAIRAFQASQQASRMAS